MGTIRLGKRTENRSPLIKDFVPLAGSTTSSSAAGTSSPTTPTRPPGRPACSSDEHLAAAARTSSRRIKPRPAVFDPQYVKKLDGPNVKKGKTKRDLAEQLRPTSSASARRTGCDRLVMVWCGSTEVYREAERRPLRRSRSSRRASTRTTPTSRRRMIYAYARDQGGHPVRQRRARTSRPTSRRWSSSRRRRGTPIRGKDFKTGQTLMKTILAPGFKARLLGHERLVLDQHPRQPRRRGARRPRVLQDQGGEQARRPRAHPPAAPLPRPLRQDLPQGAHQLLPAARRQQGRLGQHRHLRVAGLPDADQGRLPLPRLDPRGADRARPGALHRPRAARRHERDPGVALVLLQEPA